MTRTRPRLSGITMLAAAVVLLLPALAWLQYSWLDQIAEADRERRRRTLQTAVSQLAQDIDSEIGRAAFSLQLDPASAASRDWTAFASQYRMWVESAAAPSLVKAVYFVPRPSRGEGSGGTITLFAWNPERYTFEESAWPDELSGVRARFEHDYVAFLDVLKRDGPAPTGQARSPDAPRESGLVGRGLLQRIVLPPAPGGDGQTLVLPIVRVDNASDAPARPIDVTLVGFSILRFDLDAMGREVLPALVRRHLYHDDTHTEFAIAVVSQHDPSQVIFESQPGAAAVAAADPDVSAPLPGSRLGSIMLMARSARSDNAPSPPPPPPADGRDVIVNVIERRTPVMAASIPGAPFPSDDGYWRVLIKHRAGSLEAAVAAARTRNFILSSGILVLLTVAIGLIVVSARRADRLARQQLEFVAAVSHELRTPVSVINAAAGNLADGVVDQPGRVKRYGAAIQSEARRLADTVERVLQLAGISAGRAVAGTTAVPVANLVESAVAATRHEADAAGVTVEVDIAADLLQSPTDPAGVLRIIGDATALRSAIQNLISNAIKYGGEARWVRVTASSQGPHTVRIAVEDRGPGIPAADRKHIFEPFYRGRDAVARQIHGSGLGLHLVRRIVDAHGGTVTIESTPGKGTVFAIEVPAAHQAVGVPHAHEPAAAVTPS